MPRHNQLDPEVLDRGVALREELGWSCTQIAQALGGSRAGWRYRLLARGIDPSDKHRHGYQKKKKEAAKQRRFGPSEDATMLKLQSEGKPNRDIAEQIGTSRNAVRMRLLQLKVVKPPVVEADVHSTVLAGAHERGRRMPSSILEQGITAHVEKGWCHNALSYHFGFTPETWKRKIFEYRKSAVLCSQAA